MKFVVLLLGLIQIWGELNRVEALYFHIRETERKCFIEEVPDETLVVGKYKVELFDKDKNDYMPTANGIGMHVEVKDPDQRIVMSKVIQTNEYWARNVDMEYEILFFYSFQSYKIIPFMKVKIYLFGYSSKIFFSFW